MVLLRRWTLSLLMALAILTTAVGPSTAADPLEVFAGQDKLTRPGDEVVFNDAKLVRPDPPDPSKSYTFAWDFDGGQDLDEDGVGDNDNESTTLLTTHVFDRVGIFTVTLWVRDDAGGVANDTLEVTVVEDELPIALIVNITPKQLIYGDVINFEAAGTDEDGTVVGYDWESNIDGHLSSEAAFNTSSLVVGIHTISLKIRDDMGFWSEPVTATVMVKRDNLFILTVLTNRTRADTDTVVDFVVRYTDPDGDMPIAAKLNYGIDENYTQQGLGEVDPTDIECKDGKEYHFSTKLREPGNYTYYFWFKNERNQTSIRDVRYINIERVKEGSPGWWVVVTIAAVLVIIALIAWRKRSALGFQA